jgi:hypothetical protein
LIILDHRETDSRTHHGALEVHEIIAELEIYANEVEEGDITIVQASQQGQED